MCFLTGVCMVIIKRQKLSNTILYTCKECISLSIPIKCNRNVFQKCYVKNTSYQIKLIYEHRPIMTSVI